MRGPVFACLLGVLPFCGGCILSKQIAHDTKFELEMYHSVEHRRHHLHHEARDVLKEVCNRHPHKVFSGDFRHGFVDGYFDFMEYGGPVRPPAMPPAKYRTAKYLTPEGQCQIRDYNLGFLYGAQCAESTGRRQYFTVPVLVTPTTPPPQLNITTLPPLPDEADVTKPATPMVPEIAPQPKTEPMPKVETPKPMTPAAPRVETPKVDPPKAMPTTPAPMTTPVPMPMTTPLPTPRPATPPELPPAEAPKIDPKIDPKALPPKVDPPKIDPKPPVSTSIPVPLPSLPVPIPMAPSGPAPIPLIPTLPTVSLSLPPATYTTVIPASATVPAP
ncbi:hypothetical protein BH11PLA2_BH11PLA2_39300 [soil metagenome]